MLRPFAPCAILALLFLPVAACGNGGPPPGTPEATLEAMHGALESKDWPALFELMHPAEVERAEAEWQSLKDDPDQQRNRDTTAKELDLPWEDIAKLTLRDYFLRRMPIVDAKFPQDLTRTIVDVVETDDVIIYRLQGDNRVVPIRLVRVDGRWYLKGVLWSLL